jgi:hypothetical protein
MPHRLLGLIVPGARTDFAGGGIRMAARGADTLRLSDLHAPRLIRASRLDTRACGQPHLREK